MTYNFFIGFYNLLNVNIDEIVVGINVLFHKTFGFKKSWDKLPFFLHSYKKIRFNVNFLCRKCVTSTLFIGFKSFSNSL